MGQARVARAALVVLTTAVVLLPAGTARANPAATEWEFLAAINRARAAHGSGVLSISDPVTAIARRWSMKMASAGSLAHNMNLPREVTVPWEKLGENVGRGVSVSSIEEAFERSPSHYANLLDPVYDSVGIGVVTVARRIYVTVDFMRSKWPAAVGPVRTATGTAARAPTGPGPRDVAPAHPPVAAPAPPAVIEEVPAAVAAAVPRSDAFIPALDAVRRADPSAAFAAVGSSEWSNGRGVDRADTGALGRAWPVLWRVVLALVAWIAVGVGTAMCFGRVARARAPAPAPGPAVRVAPPPLDIPPALRPSQLGAPRPVGTWAGGDRGTR